MSVFRAAALVLTLAAGAGCDTSIEAPPVSARYTLWGAFDPTAAVQAVRVVPVTDTISLGSPAPLDVTVRSVDLVTRVETAWADTVVVYADGSVGHVFRAAFTPAFGSRHLFLVTGPEGSETSAVVAVPAATEPVLQTPTLGGGATYTVFWPASPRLNSVRVTYLLEDGDCGVFPHVRDFEGAIEPGEFGWTTTLNLREEALAVRGQFDGRRLAVREITVAAEVASEDWRPPGGVFDPEVLLEPGLLSNVTGGFGFVGAAYGAQTSWVPTAEELRTTAFDLPRFGGVCAAAPRPGR